MSTATSDVLTEERFADRRRSLRRRRLWRIVLGVLAVLAAGAVVWAVWFSSALSVSRIEISGTTTLKPMDVRSQAAVRLGEPLALVHARTMSDAEAAAATVLSAYAIGASKPAADKSVIRRILPRG